MSFWNGCCFLLFKCSNLILRNQIAVFTDFCCGAVVPPGVYGARGGKVQDILQPPILQNNTSAHLHHSACQIKLRNSQSAGKS